MRRNQVVSFPFFTSLHYFHVKLRALFVLCKLFHVTTIIGCGVCLPIGLNFAPKDLGLTVNLVEDFLV